MDDRDKWRFAIGTTSRVPGIKGLHYLMFDFDGLVFREVFRKINPMLSYLGVPWYAQPTSKGWHVYTPQTYTFSYLITILNWVGADPAWIRIGAKRGYLFLADKGRMQLPWEVERMVIWTKRKKRL